MNQPEHILIVDDEESIRFSLARYLKNAGYVPHLASCPREAQEKIASQNYAIAIVDRILANGENGLDFLGLLQKQQPFCQKVLISGFPSFESASQAIALQVFAYLAKPVRKEQILATVAQAAEESRVKRGTALREQVFSHLFDHSPDAVAVYDAKGLAEFINPAFTRLFGYSRAEALGRRFPQILKSQKKRTEFQLAELQSECKPVEYETLGVDKKGHYIHLSLSLSRIKINEDNFSYTLVIYRQAKIIDQYTEIKGQLKESEGSGCGKGPSQNAIRKIVHDFKNIINIILGNSELCKMLFAENHEASNLLNNIVTAGHKAQHLTEKALSGISPRNFVPQPVALDVLVEETLRLMAPTIPENISVHYSLSSELETDEPVVAGDFEQLQRVVVNLLTNAVHAMQPSGGQLEVSIHLHPSGEVHTGLIVGGRASKTLCLRMRDTGCGMDESMKKRIFDPFYTTKPEGRGTGFGLAVAFEIIQELGGSIHVESQPGKGSIFFVYLPEYVTAGAAVKS